MYQKLKIFLTFSVYLDQHYKHHFHQLPWLNNRRDLSLRCIWHHLNTSKRRCVIREVDLILATYLFGSRGNRKNDRPGHFLRLFTQFMALQKSPLFLFTIFYYYTLIKHPVGFPWQPVEGRNPVKFAAGSPMYTKKLRRDYWSLFILWLQHSLPYIARCDLSAHIRGYSRANCRLVQWLTISVLRFP